MNGLADIPDDDLDRMIIEAEFFRASLRRERMRRRRIEGYARMMADPERKESWRKAIGRGQGAPSLTNSQRRLFNKLRQAGVPIDQAREEALRP